MIRAGTHGTTDVDGQTLILGVPLLVKCCKRGMPYLEKGGEPGRILITFHCKCTDAARSALIAMFSVSLL